MFESFICSRNFYVWGYRVYYRVHKNSPFDISTKLLATPLRLGPPSGLFLRRVRNKICHSTHGCQMTRPFHRSWFYNPNNQSGTNNDTLHHVTAYVFPLCPFCYNIFLTSLCFQTEPTTQSHRQNYTLYVSCAIVVNPYPTAFPYGNGMVLHFYQQQESSTTKTVHRVINKGLKTYV